MMGTLKLDVLQFSRGVWDEKLGREVLEVDMPTQDIPHAKIEAIVEDLGLPMHLKGGLYEEIANSIDDVTTYHALSQYVIKQ
jgi:hypothetical protein